MLYRFHYQLTADSMIAEQPVINDQLWNVNYAAFAYIEARSLKEAYTKYCKAIIWWNAHLNDVFSASDSLKFQAVEFFSNDLTRELAEQNTKLARRLPLRFPEPGDVFEVVRDHGYMLKQAEDAGHPFQWLRLLPKGAVLYSED